MVPSGKARSPRLAVPLLVAAVIGAGAFAATASAASDPVTEVGAGVQKVTEELPPPVRTVEGTVLQPVHTVAGVAATATNQAGAAATSAADKAGHRIEDQVAAAAGGGSAVARESIAASEGGGRPGAVIQGAAPATPGKQAAPAPAVPATAPPVADPSGVEAAGPSAESTSAATAPTSVETGTADARNSMTSRSGQGPARGPGQDTFEAPSVDGSVRAPFDKLVAYVWPAVALGRATADGLFASWARDALRLAAASRPGAYPGDTLGRGALGVAGAHAEHVPQQPPFSIRSLLQGVPRFDAAWSSDLSPGVLLSFIGAALGTLAVFLTMLWDIGVLGGLRGRDRRRVGMRERRP